MKKIVPPDELANHLGEEIGCSDWVSIDQQRIDRFADVSEDHQFIHVDPDRAAQGPFGTTIAHGFLTLSLLTRLTRDCCLLPENTVMGINYGFDKVRFIEPVRAGQRIRARVKPLRALQRQPGQYLITSEISVEIEGAEKPALVAEWLALAVTG